MQRHGTINVRILGDILASKAPRIKRKMAIPVKEVKADMIQRLAPHPKNLKIRDRTQRRQETYTEADPSVHWEFDQGVHGHWGVS